MNGEKVRRVLWTGGLDSTFRVCWSLLVDRVDVQPIYVIDPERRSTQRELETMSKMRGLLETRVTAKLLPTVIYNRADFPVPSHIQRAFEKIRRKVHIGSQYQWLAAVAEALGWKDVEMCLHLEAAGTAPWKDLVFAEWPSPELRDSEEAQLFRYWSFPLLHLTKTEMLEEARRHGFEDILRMRWFCHRPVGSLACGRCAPCRQARQEQATLGVKFAPAPILWLHRTLERSGLLTSS